MNTAPILRFESSDAEDYSAPGALLNLTRELTQTIEFSRRMLRQYLTEPERFKGCRRYYARLYCQTIRRARRALRETPVIEVPRWFAELTAETDHQWADLFAISDAELCSRQQWLLESAAAMGHHSGILFGRAERALREQAGIRFFKAAAKKKADAAARRAEKKSTWRTAA